MVKDKSNPGTPEEKDELTKLREEFEAFKANAEADKIRLQAERDQANKLALSLGIKGTGDSEQKRTVEMIIGGIQ